MSHKQPIAIVGIGGLFPGAGSTEDFWQVVQSAMDTARQPPPGRWVLSPELAHHPQKGTADRVYSRHACFVEGPGDDYRGLQISAQDCARLDPTVRLALVAGRDAWHDSETEQIDPKRVGVVLGNIALPTDATSTMAEWILGRDFEQRLYAGLEQERPSETRQPTAAINHWAMGLPAGVLARALGLGGTHLTLDAACASSLFALKLAVDELQAGRADAMITGGMARPDCLYTQMGFSQLGALSQSGHCAPFDTKGDGLVVGEGAGLVVVKRLADAEQHGDHIYGVIHGIGLSNDVDGNLLAPSQEGQLRAMRDAYEQASWQPSDVDLIECHATGTPVGDAVEYGSLRQLWGQTGWSPGQCTIGSVKSNIGHLLTGAGAAGLIKVLLAFEHKTLPPTANFQQPMQGLDLGQGPFTVLSQAQPWPLRAKGTPRRAAVSGFGFGGTNAHVLLEQYQRPRQTIRPIHAKSTQPSKTKIAIVGVDAAVGPWSQRQQFQHRVLGGGEPIEPQPKKNFWGLPRAPRGWFLEQLDIAMGEFRIPPKELEETLPQQLLMLQVAKRAFADAGLDQVDRLRTGVFIGVGLDLNTTNYHLRWVLRARALGWASQLGLSPEQTDRWIQALCNSSVDALNANRTMGGLGGIVASRVAREFGLGGPSFVLCSEESSGLSALEVAVRALQNRELDCALVAAVGINGDVRTILSHHAVKPLSPGCIARPFDRSADGTVLGDGAAAVVLKREPEALEYKDRIYASICGIGSATGGRATDLQPSVSCYLTALRRAYRDAGVKPRSIGYMETHGSGSYPEDRVEAQALHRFFGQRTTLALGSAKADVGHCGPAAGLISLVKACLCLYQEVLPPLRGLRQPRNSVANFLLPRSSQFWMHNTIEGPRRAGVSAMSISGHCSHAVLEAAPVVSQKERQRPLGPRHEALFVVEGKNSDQLAAKTQRLIHVAKDHTAPNSNNLSIEKLAEGWWRENGEHPESDLAVAILATSAEQLEMLASSALEELTATGDIKNRHRGRIFFSQHPLGRRGEVAFVYPGSGNQFMGMGQALSVLWPEVPRAQHERVNMLRSQLLPELVWNGDAAELDADVQSIILSQVALGIVTTELMQGFGVEPQAVIGYSLGETAGLFSLGAWRARDEILLRVKQSELFSEQLAGPCRAAQRAWGLSKDQKVDWSVGVIDRPATQVRQAISQRQRVYLLIVNTPSECVIGGDRGQVQKLVADLDALFVPLKGVSTVHCEIVAQVEKLYHDLHQVPTTAPENVRFYSGAWGESYRVDSKSAADAITAQALHGVDFPRVVNRAYDDGVRLFIEMGPQRSCTRMIERILEGKAFSARALCVADQDAAHSVLQVLATLVSERVPVKWWRLFEGVEKKPAPKPTKSVQVKVGADGFHLNRAIWQIAAENQNVIHQESTQTTWAEPTAPELPQLQEQPVQLQQQPVQLQQQPVQLQPDTPLGGLVAASQARSQAHLSYLQLAAQFGEMASGQLTFQQNLVQQLQHPQAHLQQQAAQSTSAIKQQTNPSAYPPRHLNRDQCLEFAVGSIGKVLGPDYAAIDDFPTRVRLPDQPLMLVDRILDIRGEPHSLQAGQVTTEHDIHPDAWYLDSGRIATCIAVEAGQADLFLSAYLGIDFETKGNAVYRLLDAVVCFHNALPGPGQVIHYVIDIERFVQQGSSWLFWFHFDASVDGKPLITMRNGCAGFFSQRELNAGAGIVKTQLDRKPMSGKRDPGWQPLVPTVKQSLDAAAVEALREGDLEQAFGPCFADLPLDNPLTIPGGLMRLVHRVTEIDPEGGRYGIGCITAEADIHPDDWFITCHFVDDRVMPGTLMYECCMHTLRIFLLRLGWVGESSQVVCQPVVGVNSRLTCRGQVLQHSKTVTYQVWIKELGYNPEPYAIADAQMYADGKHIVDIGDMSLRFTGLGQQQLQKMWQRNDRDSNNNGGPALLPAVYDQQAIEAFSCGAPSAAFGEPYRVFDEERRIARLPRPPYQFLDQISAVRGTPFVMQKGAHCQAQVQVDKEQWYFDSNRQTQIPFAVLLEMALQPCGWLAAYVGSALTSEDDLCFRNLGGQAQLLAPVLAETEVLTSDIELTDVSSSAGMIIQHYSFLMRSQKRGPVYKGTTYFGFFTRDALKNQVGIQEIQPYQPSAEEKTNTLSFGIPHQAPFPDQQMRMVDTIDCYSEDGGTMGLGFIEGSIEVDPGFWFFRAHFYQDPVWPGSLGLEAFLQLLKVVAGKRYQLDQWAQFATMPLGANHQWIYRGQVIPTDKKVTVQANITGIDDSRRRIVADGLLSVDGRTIYQMKDFALEVVA